MTQSMTGFGKSTILLSHKKITVEIKSLNSKAFDLNIKMPSVYREMELGLRNQIAKALERGKIDFSLYIENISNQTLSKINIPILELYIKQLQQIYPNGDEIELMKIAMRIPDTLKVKLEETNQDEWVEIQKVIKEAIQNIINFRFSEGQSLEKEFKLRICNIRNHLSEVSNLETERIAAIKNRLQAAIATIKLNVDENRFEQELIYYLEKLDFTEEQVRLNNHLDYFLETLIDSEANGRKLGFIVQEMGREINTMGSKANHTAIQKLVIIMKDDLEKIKEQVLNVL